MATEFKPATRTQNRLRLVIDGAAGSGKTYTALRLAHDLGKRVFVIDTQYGSAGLYAGETEDGRTWDFQHAVLPLYTVEWYEDAIHTAEKLGADVIVIDSLSSAWDDNGGILEQVDREAEKKTPNGTKTGTFSAWSKGAVLYKKLVRVILASPCHVIATLRTKTDYVMKPDENGRNRVRKVGLKPIQREGIDYEFDLGFSMDMANTATVTKTHSRLFPNGMEISQPGKETAERIRQWLSQAPEQVENIPPIEIQNTEAQLVVETNTSDEVTPEEIHRMREEIKAHLKNVSISHEQYRKW